MMELKPCIGRIGKEKYVCEYCGLKFRHAEAFRNHLRDHIEIDKMDLNPKKND